MLHGGEPPAEEMWAAFMEVGVLLPFVVVLSFAAVVELLLDAPFVTVVVDKVAPFTMLLLLPDDAISRCPLANLY